MGDAMTEALAGLRRFANLLGVVIGLFLMLPVVVVLSASLTSGMFLTFPPLGISGRWFADVVADRIWREAFLISFLLSLTAATMATVIGALAALGIRRWPGSARWVRPLFLAPMFLPYVVYGLALYIIVDELRQIGNPVFVVLGQAALSFPIAVITISAGLAGVPLNYTKAAESLGASWMMTVLRVEVPLIRRSMIASLLLTFVYCFDELLVPLFIGGVKLVPFSLQLYRATQESVSPAVAAASVILICVMLVICAIALMVTAKRGGKVDER